MFNMTMNMPKADSPLVIHDDILNCAAIVFRKAGEVNQVPRFTRVCAPLLIIVTQLAALYLTLSRPTKGAA
jgi:hypothetical protein